MSNSTQNYYKDREYAPKKKVPLEYVQLIKCSDRLCPHHCAMQMSVEKPEVEIEVVCPFDESAKVFGLANLSISKEFAQDYL